MTDDRSVSNPETILTLGDSQIRVDNLVLTSVPIRINEIQISSAKNNEFNKENQNPSNNSHFNDFGLLKPEDMIWVEDKSSVIKIKPGSISNISEKPNLVNSKCYKPKNSQAKAQLPSAEGDVNVCNLNTKSCLAFNSNSNHIFWNENKTLNKNSKETTVNKSIGEVKNWGINDVSWIHNNPETIKINDNSEIYDQWMDEEELHFKS